MMQALAYYFSLPFLYLLSILPFWLFYRVSDLVFILLYYVIGYRKKIVMENLRRSFPEVSEKEIKRIMLRFYRYLCDLFLETFKTLAISKRSMLRHCAMDEEAKELFQKLYDQKRSFIIVMGHFGNWEWAGNAFSLLQKHRLYVIYHPLANKYFNRLIVKMRTRFGTKLIEMKNTYRDMIKNRDEINATAFIADQTPPPESAHWIRFLNQDTPVFPGTETIARKMDLPVVFVNVKRYKRGYYKIFAEMLVENPGATAEKEISMLHTRRLEQEIIKQPETWLWSHKRWKHKRPQQAVEKNL